MSIPKDSIVIVVDLSSYGPYFREDIPFKAEVIEELDNELIVKSLATGREYELYHHQILELLEIEEVSRMIDLSKYGL